MEPTIDHYKQEAAEHALAYVTDGMALGLGSGSTAAHFVRAVGARVNAGLQVVGVPTSAQTEALAHELGIPLTTLDTRPRLAVTVDGADEVDLRTFALIKGGGGALLREKIVAVATDLEVIIVDESKLVQTLGTHFAVPVEIIPFGWQNTAARLQALGGTPRLRTMHPEGEGTPDSADDAYVTDSGNFILDCRWPGIPDPPALAAQIKAITGVVEHGLFIGLAGRVIVAGAAGVTIYEHPVAG